MNKSRKNKKQFTIITIIFSIISLVLLTTIAYSAFSSTMNITGMAHARVETNVRITDFRIASTNNATSSYEEFGKNHINSNINLINSSSTITYYLEITNYGTTDVGIYNVTGLPTGLNYQIKDYNLKDRICDTSGKCNSFIKRTYELIISTTASSFNGNINLEFIFKPFHKVTYTNFTGNYIDSIMDSESVEINLSNETIKYLDVKSNNVNYTYTNNILILQNVTDDVEIINIQTNFVYDYTGDVQIFNIEYDGMYQLETWGGRGGGNGGRGGYSTGVVKLRKGDTLYIYIGGKGMRRVNITGGVGGYNGGGSGGDGADGLNNAGGLFPGGEGGGGATHIATTEGLLKTLSNKIDSILIVSGGGGGASGWTDAYIGGSGGGISGAEGLIYSGTNIAGGTQTNGYAFGEGAPGLKKSAAGYGSEGSGGGGGGFYGGYTSEIGLNTNAGGGGGSGYIGNKKLKNKYMVCYNCETSSEESTKTLSTECISDAPTKDCSKNGNGYAKITMTNLGIIHEIKYTDINGSYQQEISDGKNLTVNFGNNAPTNVTVLLDKEKTTNYTYTNGTLTIPNVITDIEIIGMYTYNYDYTGDEQVFTVPRTGTYKLEVWGGQGGDSVFNGGPTGGAGGYSTGTIKLTKDQTLYINVGGIGLTCDGKYGGAGGYNGGGTGGVGGEGVNGGGNPYEGGAGGGGATHIATVSGLLSSLEQYKDTTEILIVTGGGGGSMCWVGSTKITGGSGGGIAGGVGKVYNGSTVDPGTQTSGYQFGLGENGIVKTTGDCGREGSGGGGGGYYGGHTSGDGEGSNAGGAGGSGYIGNSLLKDKYMMCYDCEISDIENTKTTQTTCSSNTPTTDCAKKGNGYAKITLIEIN